MTKLWGWGVANGKWTAVAQAEQPPPPFYYQKRKLTADGAPPRSLGWPPPFYI
ncbi:hypothetical protein COLO4_29110 [Corchorus olitorius]|uniref:Uncharacterized protein n=1 Tax=Corchorus olitorius TaxID=93759 RepID=A0A1R3HGD8_9ROSI|nr:hypothetical protein COLO4_29110 [Corchorus olitorius]